MAATVQGRISVARDDGIKLEDQENWFNFGKRYQGKTDFHGVQQVEIEYVDWQPDGGGDVRWYINKIKVVGLPDVASKTETGWVDGASLRTEVYSSRELLIMRESVLKTAVEFLRLRREYLPQKVSQAYQPPSDSELLFLAESLEAWCLGEGREPSESEPPPQEQGDPGSQP